MVLFRAGVMHISRVSVDACGEEEVLDDRDDFDLAEINEKFVKLLLIGAVEDEVGAEDKDACGHDRQQLKGLKPDYAVPQQVDLINFEVANETVIDPWESSLERLDSQSVHVVADLRLVHLQQVFEELAQGDDRLRVVRNRLQVAEVFAVHGSENEVALLLGVANVAEGCTVA